MPKCSTPQGVPHTWSVPLALLDRRNDDGTVEEHDHRWIKTCYLCGAILIEPFREEGNTELRSRGIESTEFDPRDNDSPHGASE